jgi:hypothetical protein
LDLSHPLVGSLLLPLSLALLAAGAWLLAARTEPARRPAAAVIGIALLASHIGVFGLPGWPVTSGPDKLPWLLAALLTGGLALDRLRAGPVAGLIATCIAIAATTLWLGWPQLVRGEAALVATLAGAALLGLACIGGLAATAADGAQRAAVIVVAALALAGAAFQAGSLSLMQVALALAASTGGFALWNWPRARLPLHTAGIAVGGIGGIAIALLLLLLTDIQPAALVAIAAICLAGPLSRRLPVPERWSRAAAEPVYIAVIGLLPLIAGVLLATPPALPDDPYYR